MKILVKVKPASKINIIKKINDNQINISVKEPPVQGKANQAVIKLLAEYFKVMPKQIKILSGWSSKNKIIEKIYIHKIIK